MMAGVDHKRRNPAEAGLEGPPQVSSRTLLGYWQGQRHPAAEFRLLEMVRFPRCSVAWLELKEPFNQ